MKGAFVDLTLSSIVDGKLEEQFQRALSQVAGAFEDQGEYESNKDDVTRTQVPLEIDISRQLGQMIIGIDARARMKMPLRKRIGTNACYGRGSFSVSELTQADMFRPERPRVRALRPDTEQGDVRK